MDGEAPRLELVNLKVTVPARGKTLPVVRGVSWKIAPGETVCVVGESGAGKSMSMYAAARLEPQGARVEGSVLFNGRDVLTMKRAELRALRGRGGLGFVFQDPSSSLNPCMSIGAQLMELLRRHQRVGWRAAAWGRWALEPRPSKTSLKRSRNGLVARLGRRRRSR